MKSLCKRYVAGKYRGVEAIGVGGVQEAGEERMGELAGEINKDPYRLIL